MIFGPLFKSKKQIIKNLEKANIQKKQNLKKIAFSVLGNYGRIFAEYVHLENFRNDKLKKYNCELVPVYIERKRDNYFKMFISKPIKINNKKSIIEITKFLNNLLERMILRNIDQWIWTHNRWKD